MRLTKELFESVARGGKVIESRLFDEKRKAIKLGDEIMFSENDHPNNNVKSVVIGLLHYQSFKDLFADHDPALFGGESEEQLLSQIKQFYSDEDEQKDGVLGIRLRLTK